MLTIENLRQKLVAVLLAGGLVVASLAIADYVAWLRLKPEVSAVGVIADRSDYESHLVNIHHRAMQRAKGAPDSFLPVYDIQNPGFFLLVAEFYARAGATTPLPLQITSIALFNLGALLFFGWVYLLFCNLFTAAFATVCLALSQFFVFFSGLTHTMPYEFFFFNLTLLLHVLFLRTSRPAYFVGALVAMFLTCMNYWFYYMSSWIIMLGLWWQYRGRPAVKDVIAISAPPLAALLLTAAMIMTLFGGFWSGMMRMVDLLVARTLDARIPGGHWYPDQRFMDAQAWSAYPSTVSYRLEWAYSINLFWFAVAAGLVFILLLFRDRKALVSSLILLMGGMSWYYVMFQHTHIHHFTGQYSFMAICPIFGLILSEAIGSFCRAGQSLAPVLGLQASAPDTAPGGLVAKRAGAPAWQSLALNLAVAAVMALASWKMLGPYAVRTYGMFRDAIQMSRTVEAKYQQAVQSICRDKGQVTLSDLQAASRDWGFEWRPGVIANTNTMPRCPG